MSLGCVLLTDETVKLVPVVGFQPMLKNLWMPGLLKGRKCCLKIHDLSHCSVLIPPLPTVSCSCVNADRSKEVAFITIDCGQLTEVCAEREITRPPGVAFLMQHPEKE